MSRYTPISLDHTLNARPTPHGCHAERTDWLVADRRRSHADHGLAA